MNREIKFRAWDRKLKEWMDVEYYHLVSFEGDVYFYSMGKLSRYLDAELMQYTGLKDKNGKEIYEGDILKIKVKRLGGCSGNWYKKTNKNHGVFYLNATVKDILGNLEYNKEKIRELEQPKGKEIFSQEIGYDKNLFFNTYFSEKDYEVIGNIFENKNLLE